MNHNMFSYKWILDNVESVCVARPLCVKVGQHGCHTAQDHAEEHNDTEQHGEDWKPFLLLIHSAYITISERVRDQNKGRECKLLVQVYTLSGRVTKKTFSLKKKWKRICKCMYKILWQVKWQRMKIILLLINSACIHLNRWGNKRNGGMTVLQNTEQHGDNWKTFLLFIRSTYITKLERVTDKEQINF